MFDSPRKAESRIIHNLTSKVLFEYICLEELLWRIYLFQLWIFFQNVRFDLNKRIFFMYALHAAQILLTLQMNNLDESFDKIVIINFIVKFPKLSLAL